MSTTYCTGWPGFPGCSRFTSVNRSTCLCAACTARWYAARTREGR